MAARHRNDEEDFGRLYSFLLLSDEKGDLEEEEFLLLLLVLQIMKIQRLNLHFSRCRSFLAEGCALKIWTMTRRRELPSSVLFPSDANC